MPKNHCQSTDQWHLDTYTFKFRLDRICKINPLYLPLPFFPNPSTPTLPTFKTFSPNFEKQEVLEKQLEYEANDVIYLHKIKLDVEKMLKNAVKKCESKGISASFSVDQGDVASKILDFFLTLHSLTCAKTWRNLTRIIARMKNKVHSLILASNNLISSFLQLFSTFI